MLIGVFPASNVPHQNLGLNPCCCCIRKENIKRERYLRVYLGLTRETKIEGPALALRVV